MTTTKRDLTRAVAQEIGCTAALAGEMVDALFADMREQLEEGNRIEVRGFGVFTVKDTKPKPKALNPRTGEHVYVPARRKAHFKPGKLLTFGASEPINKNNDLAIIRVGGALQPLRSKCRCCTAVLRLPTVA